MQGSGDLLPYMRRTMGRVGAGFNPPAPAWRSISDRAADREVKMETNGYDRKADDLGNVVALEHVNITISDQAKAVVFYVLGLG